MPPCGQGGSLRDGGGELIGGSRGGGCLNTDDSAWLLWEDFSSGECLFDGTRTNKYSLLLQRLVATQVFKRYFVLK